MKNLPQLSAEEIERNKKIVLKLWGKLSEHRQETIKFMFSDSKVLNSEYFLAPCSTRIDYYGCYPGGLCEHSLVTLDNLKKISAALCPGKYSEELLITVALFHDLGKAGDGENSYYQESQDGFLRDKRGILYEINKDCLNMPDAERALFVLQKYTIELSPEEYLAIRLNDGQYAETNRPYKNHEPDLALLLHWACLWASRQSKKEEKCPF